MRYALIAAALVGAVAASPAWAPPAYGGSDDGSWGSASTVDQTTVVTITSCGPEVTDCPAASTPYSPATTSAEAVPPPAYTTATSEVPATSEASTPYSPETTSAVSSVPPPAYGSPSAPASVPASSPYSPEQPSSYESLPPPAVTAPVGTAPASSPYSPIGGTAPPVYPSGSAAPPAYPIPGNGTWGSSPTASGAPSGSQGYPVQQTGNSAVGLKAGSFLAGAGAFAALLL